MSVAAAAAPRRSGRMLQESAGAGGPRHVGYLALGQLTSCGSESQDSHSSCYIAPAGAISKPAGDSTE